MTDDIAACPHSLAERETAVADGMCPICSADALSHRSTPPLPDEERERLAKLIEPSDDEVYPPSWTDDKILGNRLARAWAAAVVRGGPVEGIDPHVHRPPLPKEIAGLIDHAKQYFHIITRKEMAGEFPQIGLPAYIEKMASALRALALENERVSTENDTLRNSVDAVRARYLQGVFNEKARGDQLEAERDEAKADYLRRHKDVGDQMDRRIKAEAERDAVQANLEQTSKWLQGAHLEMGRIRAKTIEECMTFLRQKISCWAAEQLEDHFRALVQTDEGKTETGE